MRANRTWGAAVALVSCTLALGWPRPAAATVVVHEEVEDQVRAADAVVLATVARVGTRQVAGGTHTVVRLRVERWLKGRGGRVVTLEEPGGRSAHGLTRVAGAPRYAPGDRVVAMLQRHADGTHRTRGLAAGRYLVLPTLGGDPPVVRDLRDLTMVTWAGGRMRAARGGVERYALRDLLRRIEAVVAYEEAQR
ncbi:MAG TPA: hypothetical protein RMH99_06690 [Sandaracinaceae bacterium LLY-WYZ-13_1]|nr:hypothetical protein [Sandaracinaceae bacterium LLY-WYZ-13_1]